MSRRAYTPHDSLVAPARQYPQLWRLIVGLVVAGFVAFSLGLVVQLVLGFIAPGLISANPDSDVGQGNTPGSLLIMLYGFVLIIIGVFVAAQALHDRDPLGLIGPIPLAVWQFWRVFRTLILLGLVLMILPPYSMGDPLVKNLDFSVWIILLPFSLTAILIQSASEEILFRGYIQQSLAARFSNPLVWMVVPALLFGLGHYAPSEMGDNATIIAVWSVIFGLLMADLTARAGTLGPAIALHMANNISALLLISVPDTLSGLSLATTPHSIADTEGMRDWLMIDFAFMFVSWLAARLAIRR